ncbi:type III polyketide synthase [Yersinia massiliensis]|uniref:type III polyketide synthase n=1 Tax=Yersinia massiliensis TaxID=419257 RepID=UPI000314903F|nr:type III polyketide synthase [Yersinia massiliensis]
MIQISTPTICKPAVILPKYSVTQKEIIEFIKVNFSDTEELPKAIEMISNNQVLKRHFIRPLEEIIFDCGLEKRNSLYIKYARQLAKEAALQAIKNSGLALSEINMVIATSCTGISMPSLTTMLINDLELSATTRQLPISQLGCSAGTAAVNLAVDYCNAHPGNNVLIVNVELCSLLFHPEDTLLSSLISASLFGDAATASVVRGEGGKGFAITATHSFLLSNSEDYIYYKIKDAGFYFRLNKKVMSSIKLVIPEINDFLKKTTQKEPHEMDFYVFHTGGKRILDELVKGLFLQEEDILNSRNSLSENGNLSSAAVFDVLNRLFENEPPLPGQKGLMVAFGPGFSTEISTGFWV